MSTQPHTACKQKIPRTFMVFVCATPQNWETCQTPFCGLSTAWIFFLNFFYVPVSPFSEINFDLVCLHLSCFKSFPLWVGCLKFYIWWWKRKILPKCKHHGVKETVGFFVFVSVFQFHSLKIQTTLNSLQKHISNAVLPSLTHAQTRAHTWGGGLFLKMLRDKI